MGQGASPAQECGAVGGVGKIPGGARGQPVAHPPGLLVGAPGATAGQEGPGFRAPLRLHEELGEGGVGQVCLAVIEHRLQARGHLDAAGRGGAVDQGEAARLGVAGREHHHLQGGDDAPVLADQGGLALLEAGAGRVRDLASRAQARGPELPGVQVLEVDEETLGILHPVAPPAREGLAPARRVSGAALGEKDPVPAVVKKMPAVFHSFDFLIHCSITTVAGIRRRVTLVPDSPSMAFPSTVARRNDPARGQRRTRPPGGQGAVPDRV